MLEDTGGEPLHLEGWVQTRRRATGVASRWRLRMWEETAGEGSVPLLWCCSGRVFVCVTCFSFTWKVVKCLWEVFIWGFGVLFLSCVCASVSGVVFSVGVCMCDLLIFLPSKLGSKATPSNWRRLKVASSPASLADSPLSKSCHEVPPTELARNLPK